MYLGGKQSCWRASRAPSHRPCVSNRVERPAGAGLDALGILSAVMVLMFWFGQLCPAQTIELASRAQGGPAVADQPQTGPGFKETVPAMAEEVPLPMGCDGNHEPVAVIAQPIQAVVGVPVLFDGSASYDDDGEIMSCEWRFGETGQTQLVAGLQTRHTFDAPGLYPVDLSVWDDCDAEGSATLMVQVTDGDPCANNLAPVANAGSDQSAIAGKPTLFDGSGSSDGDGDSLTYAWDFGDGSEPYVGPDPTASHEYDTPGQYTVTLTVTDGCEATSVDTVVVSIALTPDFWFMPASVKAGEQVAFHAYAPPGLVSMYRWTFSDRSGMYGRDVIRPYNYPGTFTVSLMIVPKSGGTLYSQPKTVTVAADPPLRVISVLETDDLADNQGTVVLNSIAWTVGLDGRWVAANVSNPLSPQRLDGGQACTQAWDIAARGSVVAVAAGYAGVQFLRADDPRLFDAIPENVAPVAAYDTFGEDGTYAVGVAFVGERLYVACGSCVKILDVGPVQSLQGPPTLVASVGWLGSANSRILVVGNRAYVGAGDPSNPGVYILDVTNPDAPVLLGWASTACRPFDLSVSGAVLGVVERWQYPDQWPGKVAFFDVANPAQPVFLSRVGNSSSAYRRVVMTDEVAYVAEYSRIRKLDLGDPANPVFQDSAELGYVPGEMWLGSDGRIYTGLWHATLAVLEP